VTFNTPADLTDVELWLRADLGVTQSGGQVSTWADQSGNGNDFVQATGANKPTTGVTVAGQTALDFSGSQWLHCTNSFNFRPMWVFVICERTGTSSNVCALFSTDEPGLAGQSIGWDTSNIFQIEVKKGSPFSSMGAGATIPINTPMCLTCGWVDTGLSSPYADPSMNGVRTFSGAGGPYNALTSTAGSDVGAYDASATFGVKAKIAEVVVVSAQINAGGDDMDQLLNYFNERYGVPGKFNQPYYAVVFRGNTGVEQLPKGMQSPNGTTWSEFLSYYIPPTSVVRDPAILSLRPGGKRWLAYTNSTFGGTATSFGVANSTYGLGWTHVANPDCSAISGIDSPWGPKWHIDNAGGLHILIALGTGGTAFDIYELHPTNAGMTTWSTPVALTFGSGMPTNPLDFVTFRFNRELYAIVKDEGGSGTLWMAKSSNGEWDGTWTGIINNIGGWSSLEGPTGVQTSRTSIRIFMDDYNANYNDQTTGGSTGGGNGNGMHFSDGTGSTDPTLMSWTTPTIVVWDTANQATVPETFWSRNGTFIYPGPAPPNFSRRPLRMWSRSA